MACAASFSSSSTQTYFAGFAIGPHETARSPGCPLPERQLLKINVRRGRTEFPKQALLCARSHPAHAAQAIETNYHDDIDYNIAACCSPRIVQRSPRCSRGIGEESCERVWQGWHSDKQRRAGLYSYRSP